MLLPIVDAAVVMPHIVDAEDQESVYEIRLARSEEIDTINKLFFDEYGAEYPYPVDSLSVHGVNLVALHRDTQEVIGFSRALPFEGSTEKWEFGGLIVHRKHRRSLVAKQLTTLRVNIVSALGARVIVSEPVCYRHDCASQHNLIRHGFILLGIQPGKYPDILRRRLGPQGESVLLAAKWIDQDFCFSDRALFLPPDYGHVIERFLPGRATQRPLITVMPLGMPPCVTHEGHQSSKSAGACFVDVPINWIDAIDAIMDLRERGYKFSCVLPGFGKLEGGIVFDYIRLYKPSSEAERFDFRLVNTVPQLQELREFCALEESGLI